MCKVNNQNFKKYELDFPVWLIFGLCLCSLLREGKEKERVICFSWPSAYGTICCNVALDTCALHF